MSRPIDDLLDDSKHPEILPELQGRVVEDAALTVELIIWRVGEMFGEFGVAPLAGDITQNNPLRISKWRLQITTDAHVTVHDDVYPSTPALSKVVKLKASTAYLVRGCVYSDELAAWGQWSPVKHTRTFPPVLTSVAELGEDYVRLLWDRQLRDSSLIDAEAHPEAMEIVSHVSQFQLRVVRESDMQQELHEEFPVGVRSYTLHDLRPATAYIVFVRYATLINTLKQWSEVCRFVTQASHDLSLESRGENTFTIAWTRSTLPQTMGYLMPDPTIHKFEVTIDGGRHLPEPIELASNSKSHTFVELDPATTYKVRFRCLTKEGRWTSKTKPLVVKTAARPIVSVTHTGETFATIGWTRDPPEAESKIFVELVSNNRHYNRNFEADLHPGSSQYHLGGLVAGTTYEVRIKTFVQGCWGLFTQPMSFKTRDKISIRLSERGENFFNIVWPTTNRAADEMKWNVHVAQIASDGSEHVVLDAESTNPGCRIDDLQPNTTYRVKARGWQVDPFSHDAGWGEFSTPVVGHTLRSIALQLMDVGENFAQITWTRDLQQSSGGAPDSKVVEWGDLKYEITLGCYDAEEDRLLHREVLDTTYTVSNLLPDTMYIVSVRACDERRQWGEWRHLKFRTLATVVLSMHEIGEDYTRVMWRRHEDKRRDDVIEDDDTDAQNAFVSQFFLFIFSADDAKSTAVECSESGYHRGGDAEVRIWRRIASQHQSYRVDGLLPDREYIAVIRASTASNKWGLWCKEVRFRTVSPFRIPARELNIGENYVNLVWSRDEHPSVQPNVFIGDYTVIGQELLVTGIDVEYRDQKKLKPDQREEKLSGLKPATAYTIQIRACNSAGEWGLWSTPVQILTRATIVTRAVEVAEDYIVVAWERTKAPNPRNYPTGKGLISSYRLRVTGKHGVCAEATLSDQDCPFRTPALEPDSFYLVELKANYNDEEWGQWSVPLWCLTMTRLVVRTPLISEEFCHVSVSRPHQDQKLPSDVGFADFNYKLHSVVPGKVRETVAICVTAPVTSKPPHGGASTKQIKSRTLGGQRVPEECADERLIYEVEITDKAAELKHVIPTLKADTIYTVSARSKIANGDWAMWSEPNRFITLSPVRIQFIAIGENYLQVDWRRSPQEGLGANVNKGVGYIARSRVKVRDLTGAFSETYEVDSSDTTWTFGNLQPSTTYAVSVQTLNDNHDWGAWSEESKVRTTATMGIDVEHVGEDAVWLSWIRQGDMLNDVSSDTALSVDTQVRSYELMVSSGNGEFTVQRSIERDPNKAGGNCFLRGLVPDTVYEVKVRAQSKSQTWGLWSTKYFRTLPMMRVTFGNIGEHFAVVDWRRHLPAALRQGGPTDVFEGVDQAELYRLRVQVGDQKPTVYELPNNMSSYRLSDLKPSTEYRVWICARGREGVWGLWNTETRVRTLPQLNLTVEDIGEDYVNVSWRRLPWAGQPKLDHPEIKTWEIDGAVSGYEVQVRDELGNVKDTFSLSYTQQRCSIPKLEPRSVYTVSVRALDTYKVYGLWSETSKFVTLYPVSTRLVSIGEDYIKVEWDRRNILASRLQARKQLTENGGGSVSANDEEESEGTEDMEDFNATGTLDDAEFEPEDSMDMSTDLIHLDDSTQQGNESVRKWHVRLYTGRLSGSLPISSDYREFFPESNVVEFDIRDLVPENSYSVTVRAQNSTGEWGAWSKHVALKTLPLIRPSFSYIGEDFLSVTWSRPTDEDEMSHSMYHCFPAPTAAVHNYQVSIVPLASEVHQFVPMEGQPLQNGARVYETSQPSLRLVSLMPGTRYRIEVREQQIDSKHNFVDSWGMPSEAVVVETIEAMTAVPEHITENGATINWHRQRPDRDPAAQVQSVIRSAAKISMYEVEVFRMDEKGANRIPSAYSFKQQFAASLHSTQLPNLNPNFIYGVVVRAQTAEGGSTHWGKWCSPIKFVTQKKLVIGVDLINETNALVSWSRALPDWEMEQNATTAVVEEDDEGSNADAASVASETTTPTAPFRTEINGSIIRGEYHVLRYELTVEGIGHAYAASFELPADKVNHTIDGLQPNKLYSVRVRGLSTFGVWSVPSANVSLCTLKPMQLVIGRSGEHYVEVSWHRPPQDVMEHSKILERLLEDKRRDFERETKEIGRSLQKLQERHDLEEGGDEEGTSTLRQVSDLTLQRESLREAYEEFVVHLQAENVAMGRADAGAYELRIFGDRGLPYIIGATHLLDTKKTRKSKSRTNPPSTAVSPQRSVNAAKPPRRSKTTVAEVSMTETDFVQPEEEREEDGLLFGVKMNNRTNDLVIHGLEPLSAYTLDVRSRNPVGEWGPWSDKQNVTTVDLLKLEMARIGEQYAHLYWHRLIAATRTQWDADAAEVAKWEEEMRRLSPADLEAAKKDPEKRAEMKSWRARQKEVQKRRDDLQDGRGAIVTGEGTTIAGYHLRIVHLPHDDRNAAQQQQPTSPTLGDPRASRGNYTDYYFPNDSPHSYTVTKLQSNCLYAAMACIDYGNGLWGAWTAPIKFMTQNLMQLSINYVSETFVDLEWKRAPNRRLPRGEENVMTVSPSTQGPDNLYEVSVQWVDKAGVRHDDRREVRATTFFRVLHLDADQRYELCVREKDNRGQWGLWSASKACVTLPSMTIHIGEVGEDWMTMAWNRLDSSRPAESSPSKTPAIKSAAEEIPLVELPVAEMAFYLRVVELEDNGTAADGERLKLASEKAQQDAGRGQPDSPSKHVAHEDDDFMDTAHPTAALQPGSALPPAPAPEETTPVDNERYHFIKRFPYDVKSFRLDDLRPNRFYSVQVLCETTGSQRGNWSSDMAVLTLKTIGCRVALADEESVRITWEREQPRIHPRLPKGVKVITGQYHCHEYAVEAVGLNDNFSYVKHFGSQDRECRIDKLQMACSYSVKVRSTDTANRVSRWSDLLHFATLTRMQVMPETLTESFAWVEWSRQPQPTQKYPPNVIVPVDSSASYHLQVFSATDRHLPLLEKHFQGTTNRFQLTGLQPNNAYTVMVRACNRLGEWGQWSEQRVMYTMKLIEAQVQAVGEDYIIVAWRRDAPDERSEMVRVDEPPPVAFSASQEDDEDAPTKPREIVTRRQFPLLDKPTKSLLLYRSDRTRITRLRINVQMAGDSDPTLVDTADDDAEGTAKIYFPVTGLRPDAQYYVSVCACYGGEDDWGLWSEPVTSCTLNTLAMSVKYVGENYISAAWSRLNNSFDLQGLQMGKAEATLCYEFVVHDFTAVPSGSEHLPDQPAPLIHDVKTRDKNQVVRDLKPNRRYRLAVRRWYRPVQHGEMTNRPSGDEAPVKSLEEELKAAKAEPGHWSETVFVLTLRRMVVTAEDIAEDFMRVQWDRDPLAVALPTRGAVKVNTVVTSYNVKIDELDGQCNITTEPGSLHFERHYAEDTMAFRVESLTPDTAYRIVVRCCTDKSWGDWSDPCVVVTLPQIQVVVESIGEDYIDVGWQRNIRTLTLPDGKVALSGNTNNLEKYQLELYNLETPYHFEKKLKPKRSSCRVKNLEPQSVYVLCIRSCDSSNTWSLWSEKLHFATLKPMQVTFGKVGEQFAHVAWSRESQAASEYRHLMKEKNAVIELGDPTVRSYHLAVFPFDHSPTTAVLDKQFSGETTSYRVTELHPATSYIAIVRAANAAEKDHWGLWSEEKIVTTLPLIQLQILSIGENYVTVKWSRDETGEDDAVTIGQGIRVEPVLYQIGVTGERTSIEKTFTIEESTPEDGTPTYSVRGLTPDTSYVVSMHACYGDDEWGLWTVPITFLTPNKLGIIVSNVSETRAEFTWGRGQQSPQHAHDPNICVWQSNVIKYQLVLRKATLGTDVDAHADFDPDNPTSNEEDDVRVIERVMDSAHSRYMQTFCVIENLQVNTDYHVQVRALDNRKEWGEWSHLIFDTPPMPPQHPTLRKHGNAALVFTWDPPDTAGQYLYLVEQSIAKEKKPNAKGSKDPGPEATEWRPVEPGTFDEPVARIRATGPLAKIRVRVKCCKVDRPVHLWSQFTQPVSLTSQQAPLPVPYLNVVSTSRTTVHLEWGRSPSAPAPAAEGAAVVPAPPTKWLAYKVLVAARDQPMQVVATVKGSTACEVPDLTPNTAYRVQVQVETDSGVSQSNPIQKFTTRADGTEKGKPGQAAARPDGKLPALSTSKGTQSARGDRVDVAFTPKPPTEPSQTARASNRPHPPTPTSKRGSSSAPVKPLPKPTRPGSSPNESHRTTPSQQQPTLPPVERRGPPPEQERDNTAVADYDVVAFSPSEDGDAV